MHVRSRHLVIFLLIVAILVFIVGFFIDTAEAPENSVGDQSASVLFATQEDTYAVDRTHAEAVRNERAAFIEKVRRSLPSDVPATSDLTEEVSTSDETVSDADVEDVEVTSSTDVPILLDEHVEPLVSPIPDSFTTTTTKSEVPQTSVEHSVGTQTPYGNTDF